MSVLIKGMDMPKHLDINGDHDSIFKGVIVVHKDGTAEFIVNLAGESTFARCNDSRLERFPCIDVPTPHGRLIDADELETHSDYWWDIGEYVFADTIRNADTIIEAEVSV